MEMNAPEKCDLNHFGYGLRAFEAWKISPFLSASISLSMTLFLSPLNVIQYILCYETYSTMEDDLYFFYIRKEDKAIKKKKKIIPASSGVGSCFLGNVSDCNDFSSCVL